jgi:hypothetical protein
VLGPRQGVGRDGRELLLFYLVEIRHVVDRPDPLGGEPAGRLASLRAEQVEVGA